MYRDKHVKPNIYIAILLIPTSILLFYAFAIINDYFVGITIVYVAISLFPFAIHKYREHVDVFRPDMFFTGILFVYTIPVPLDILLWDNSLKSDVDLAAQVLLYTLIHQLVYLSVFYVLPRREEELTTDLSQITPISNRVPLIIMIFGALLFTAYIQLIFGGFYTYLFGFERLDRFHIIIHEVQSAFILRGGLIVFQTGWILFFFNNLNKAHQQRNTAKFNRILFRHFIFMCLYSLFFLFSGDRAEIVLAFLVMAYVYSRFRQVKINMGTIIIIIGIMVFFQVFARGRYFVTQPTQMIDWISQNFDINWLNMAQGEFGAQYLIAMRIMDDIDSIGYQNGQTYANGFAGLIPSALWPDRPLKLDLWYVKRYYPSLYDQGMTFAFSYSAEGFLNFGWYGALITGLILGILARWAHGVTHVKRTSAIKIMLYGSLVLILSKMIRTGTDGIIPALIPAVVVPLFLVVSLRIMRIWDQSFDSHLNQTQ